MYTHLKCYRRGGIPLTGEMSEGQRGACLGKVSPPVNDTKRDGKPVPYVHVVDSNLYHKKHQKRHKRNDFVRFLQKKSA